MQHRTRTIALTLAAGVVLAGCATQDPTDAGTSDEPAGDSIVIGSFAFPESVILAEIYAQALEDEGFDVERSLEIGQRPVTYQALEDGSITLIPEYSGNLLGFLDTETTASGEEEIMDALDTALEGTGLQASEAASARDEDAYVVTRETADSAGLVTIGDLAALQPVRVGANPEFAELSYGLPGLAERYGVTDYEFESFEDSGGPTTVAALLDGTVDVANIYTTSPAIGENDLVVLEDPENMIRTQNVVPVFSDAIASDELEAVLDEVSAELTTDDLIALRTRVEGDESATAADAARDWLVEKELITE